MSNRRRPTYSPCFVLIASMSSSPVPNAGATGAASLLATKRQTSTLSICAPQQILLIPKLLSQSSCLRSQHTDDDPARTATTARKLTFFSLVGACSQLYSRAPSCSSSIHRRYPILQCKFSPPSVSSFSIRALRSYSSPLRRLGRSMHNSPFLTRLTDT